MKILYSKKRRKYDLFYTIFCLLMGIFSFFLSDTNQIFFYLFMPLGLISLYLYIKVKYYLTLENNEIKQNYIFGKKIKLSEIKSIKHFAGEYILRTDTRKMTINTSWVDQSSLIDLKAELTKLDVQWV
ncbi:MAG: hypothetical protein ACPH3L_08285 [Flavobacteriaceae bacterium]